MTKVPTGLTLEEAQNSRLGVVLSGYNCRIHVNETLSAIMKLGLPVLYVDMASIDDSVDCVRRLGVRVRELSINLPISRARAFNEGSAALLRAYPHLEIIQFMRVGCVLDPVWPAIALRTFDRHPRLGALAGLSFSVGKKGREKLLFIDLVQGYLSDLNGGDFLVRAALLRKLRGFDTLPRLGFETEFILRAKHAGFFARRISERMMTIDPDQMKSFMMIRPTFRQGYIQYYLLFKAPTFALRSIFFAKAVWVSFWTLWLPISAIVLTYANRDARYLGLFWAYLGFVLGVYMRRRIKIRFFESHSASLVHALKLVLGFWPRLLGHLKAFSDLSNQETQKLFSKKKSRRLKR